MNAKGECGLWRITVSFANPSLSPFHQRFLEATTKTPAGPTTLWLRECPMSGQYLPRTPSSGALQASKIIGICKTACCSTDPRQSVVCHVYITVNNRYLLMKMLFSRLHHHFPKFPLASSNFSPSSYQRSLIVPAPSRATESQHAQRHLHRELYLLYLLSRGVRPDPLHPLHLTGMDCILAFSASSSYVSVIYPIPHMGLSSWNVRWTGSRNRGIRRSGPASLRCIRPEHLYNLLHRYHHRSGILLGVDLPESCANHPSLRRRSHAFRSSNNHFCVHVLRLRLASSSSYWWCDDGNSKYTGYIANWDQHHDCGIG
jgi:hypothetical protein